MLLAGKNAVVYGAGGSVGGAVARAFARDGARVSLVGRTRAPLELIARAIRDGGGDADIAVLDALDESAVEVHLDSLAARGSLDVSFNAAYGIDVQGRPLTEISGDEFLRSMETRLRANFNTATTAARRMVKQGSGVIQSITARPDLINHANSGGFGVSCAALESFCRQLAIDVGPSGVRVICIRSSGSPDAAGVRAALELHAGVAGVSFEEFAAEAGSRALLKHLPLLAEVANAAVIMASDRASAITGTVANVTCGEVVA
jgi:NAD(P)-dependent dehydrogenase (short-subunit alcohol dehydrogenase family)